jgi:hypothetical protein
MQIGQPPSYSRRLGEDFVPARPFYLTQIPAILVLTGLVTWIAGTELAMVAAAVIATLVALYLLWDWLFREGPTRFSTLMAMTLLLGYGAGAVNTWLTLPRAGLSLTAVLGADEAVLARGMAAVLLSAAPLCFIGEMYERPLFGREFRIPLDQQTYAIIVLGTIAIVTGFFTHQLGYMGAQVAAGEQVSVATELLTWLFPPLTALTVAIFLATRRGFAKLVSGVCTVVLCIFLMVVGRRVLVYTVMEVLFALRFIGYRLKGTFFKKALLLTGLAVFLAVGVTVFMLLRLAASENHYNANTPLAQRIQIAMTWVQDGTALARATEANQTNAQKRTFVLGFFSDVLEGSSTHTPALGKDLVGYTQLAIPRLLNPGKDVDFSEEALDDELFGLTYRDAANSILTNGATDFGLIGALVYPLMVTWFLRFGVELTSKFLPALPLSLIALGVIFTLLQTENSLSYYLTTIRHMIIFAIVLFLFSRLPLLRAQNQ